MIIQTSSLTLGLGKNSPSTTTRDSHGDKLTLIGRSRAGEGTSFAIPELHWMLDCGALIQPWTPHVLFLTHTHSDHIHTLSYLVNRCLMMTKNQDDPTHNATTDSGHNSTSSQCSKALMQVYLPASALQLMTAHLDAYQQLIQDRPVLNPIHAGLPARPRTWRDVLVLYPTLPGQEWILVEKGRTWVIQAVECFHRVDCLGYSIFQRKAKLKEEYVGLPGPEIARFKKQGVEITTYEDHPALCFLGDTTEQVFVRTPNILTQHHCVVVECSFINEADLDRAAETQHMHWTALRPFVESHPHVLFVLIHFSVKYKALFLRNFFRQESLPNRNIHPMLSDDDVREDWLKLKTSAGCRRDDQGSLEMLIEAPPRCNCFSCSP